MAAKSERRDDPLGTKGGAARDERAKALVDCVNRDWNENSGFREKQDIWNNTRYSRLDRAAGTPWSNSSDINMPVSDLYITQLAPSLMNLVFGGQQIAALTPLDVDAMATTQDAEYAFNARLRRMPELRSNIAYLINAMLTGGRGCAKVHYSRKTRVESREVKKRDLPGVFGYISWQPGISERKRQEQMFVLSQIKPTEYDEVLRAFGEPASIINKAAFKKHEDTIRRLVREAWDLSEDEEEDQGALADLMDWFRNGCPNGELVIKKRCLVEDTPRVTFVPVNDLIVPMGTQSFADADRLTHRLFFSKAEIEERVADGRIYAQAAETVLKMDPSKHRGGGAFVDIMRMSEEQRQNVPDRGECYELWEVYHKCDIDGDGLAERVVTLVHPESGTVLKEREYPYNHGAWPFVWIPFEAHLPDFHAARGVPEVLMDIETHVTAWHRAMENHLTISTSLTFLYRRNLFTSFDEIQFAPGYGVPVEDPLSDIRALEMPQTTPPIERMTQFLMLWPERLIGGVDNQMMANAHLTEPRTATEMSQMESARQRILGMRATVFLEGLNEILRQLYALDRQFGPDVFFIAAVGEKPKTIRQYDVRGAFDIEAAGAVGNMDPAFLANSKLEVLMALAQFQPVLQSDPRYEFDFVQTFVDWAMAKNPVAARRAVRKRPEAMVRQLLGQQMQQAQAMGQAADVAKRLIANEEVTDEEMAMVMHLARTMAPHKDLQRVVEAGDQAVATAQRNALVTGAPNGR